MVDEYSLAIADRLNDEQLAEREDRICGDVDDDDEEEREKNKIGSHPHWHAEKCRPGCAIVWKA